MHELRKFVAPEFVYGRGSIALTGRYASNFGAKKPLVVTDLGVISAGLTRNVIAQLETEGIEYALFSNVNQNPRDFQAMEGARFYEAHDCDVIISIGGGSPMDCAKAIGIVCSNRLDVTEFEGVDNVRVPGPPLICIPTTAGTSADVSQFAIINNTKLRKKFAIISKTMVPDVALIDPDTTLTMPAYLTACTGMDALVHAIEAVASTASSRITDLHAFEAIRIIRRVLPAVIASPDDPELRDEMMFASMEAGLAFSNASLGAVHAMAHSLGGYLDMPHGECNAILLAPVVSFNFHAAPSRYRNIAEHLGLDVSGRPDDVALNMLVEDIIALKESVGITARIGDRGVTTEDLQILARNAIDDPCMVTNPRIPLQDEIEELYAGAI
jgi:alcohol dehydrogenase class IV